MTTAAPTEDQPSRLSRTAYFVFLGSLLVGGALTAVGANYPQSADEFSTFCGVGTSTLIAGLAWAISLLYRGRREPQQRWSIAIALVTALEIAVLGWLSCAYNWETSKFGLHDLREVLIECGLAWKIPLVIVNSIVALWLTPRILKKFAARKSIAESPAASTASGRKLRASGHSKSIYILVTLLTLSLCYTLVEPPVHTLITLRLDNTREQELEAVRLPRFIRCTLLESWATTAARKYAVYSGQLTNAELLDLTFHSTDVGRIAFGAYCNSHSVTRGEKLQQVLQILKMPDTNAPGADLMELAVDQLIERKEMNLLRDMLTQENLYAPRVPYILLYQLRRADTELAENLCPALQDIAARQPALASMAYQCIWNSYPGSTFMAHVNDILLHEPSSLEVQLSAANTRDSQILDVCLKSQSVRILRWALTQRHQGYALMDFAPYNKAMQHADLIVRRNATRAVAQMRGIPLKHTPDFNSDVPETDAEIAERATVSKSLLRPIPKC